jgi:hypothetical protein
LRIKNYKKKQFGEKLQKQLEEIKEQETKLTMDRLKTA